MFTEAEHLAAQDDENLVDDMYTRLVATFAPADRALLARDYDALSQAEQARVDHLDRIINMEMRWGVDDATDARARMRVHAAIDAIVAASNGGLSTREAMLKLIEAIRSL